MSYILNALRKSENERKAKEQPITQESFDTSEISLQNTKVIGLIIALVCINILILIYFVFYYAPSQPSSSKPEETEQKTTLEPPKTIVKVKGPILKKTKPQKNELIVKKDSRTTIKPPLPEPNQQASISEMLKRQQRPVKKTVAPLSPNKKNKTIEASNNKSKKSETSLTLKSAFKEPGPLQPQSQSSKKTEKIAFLTEMAPEFRRSVPNLNINVFVYAKEPENRFVIIDMKKYRTGEETESGVKIKEIKKESMVLQYNNRTFQINRP